jgi:S1-C subfamily serine protease
MTLEKGSPQTRRSRKMSGMEHYPTGRSDPSPPLPSPPPGPSFAYPETALPPGPPSRNRGRAAAVALLAGLVLIATGIGIGWDLDGRSTTGAASPIGSIAGPSSSAVDPARAALAKAVAAKVTPAVVNINTFRQDSYAPGTRANIPIGAGTGMILTSSGEVLTNNHVVNSATLLRVTIPDHPGTYTATVVGVDPPDDVAMIQIQGVSGLPTVTLGSAATLRVGQDLVAIGNALGKGGTPSATAGSVTGLNRTITANDDADRTSELLHGMIQTDAPISPGDSGGVLATANGEVVGMITAGQNGPGQLSSQVGFAIPTDNALAIVNQIRNHQSSDSIFIGPRGFLGVSVQDLTAKRSALAGVDPATTGVFVAESLPGTPAAAAGIPANVVITSIDGQDITSTTSLGSVLHQHQPGDVVQVTWVDASGSHTRSIGLMGGGPAI